MRPSFPLALLALCLLETSCLGLSELRDGCSVRLAQERARRDIDVGQRRIEGQRCSSPERLGAFMNAYDAEWSRLLAERCSPETPGAWGHEDGLSLTSRDALSLLAVCEERRDALHDRYTQRWQAGLAEACTPVRVFSIGALAGAEGTSLGEAAAGISLCPEAEQSALLDRFTQGWHEAREEVQRERVSAAAERQAREAERAADAAHRAATAQEDAARAAETASTRISLVGPFPPSEPTIVDTAAGKVEVYCAVREGRALVRAMSLSGESFSISGRWRVTFREGNGGLLGANTEYQYMYVSRGEAGGFETGVPAGTAMCRAEILSD